MKLRVQKKINSASFNSLAALLVVFSLLAMCYPQTIKRPITGNQTNAQSREGASPKKKKLKKVKDPEAIAMFIHLLERYANNVASQTEMDKRFAQALSKKAGSREIAKRMMANFRELPVEERRVALAQYADISPAKKFSTQEYQTAFNRLASTDISRHLQRSEPGERPLKTPSSQKHFQKEQPELEETSPGGGRDPQLPNRKPIERKPIKPVERKPFQQDALNWQTQPVLFNANSITPTYVMTTMQDQRYKLWYEGLRCVSETDKDNFTSADEIYVITTVTDASGNDSTTRHPKPHDPHWYRGLDDGETRRGPRRGCWGGRDGQPAQPLTLTVALFEQDGGNPEDNQEIIATLFAGAGAICGATNVGLVPCVVAAVVAVVVSLALELFTGGNDDLVAIKVREISAAQIRNWDNQDPQQRGNIFYHFSTAHENDEDTGLSDGAAGADYRVYFRITSPLPFG